MGGTASKEKGKTRSTLAVTVAQLWERKNMIWTGVSTKGEQSRCPQAPWDKKSKGKKVGGGGESRRHWLAVSGAIGEGQKKKAENGCGLLKKREKDHKEAILYKNRTRRRNE